MVENALNMPKLSNGIVAFWVNPKKSTNHKPTLAAPNDELGRQIHAQLNLKRGPCPESKKTAPKKESPTELRSL